MTKTSFDLRSVVKSTVASLAGLKSVMVAGAICIAGIAATMTSCSKDKMDISISYKLKDQTCKEVFLYISR